MMEQRELADRANVSPSTLKRIENTRGPVRAQYENVEALQAELERAGIEFLNGDQPGVRFAPGRAPS
mgnify:CR=1 FL=1